MENRTRVILDNIRSAHNVGSIFRTADGAGVEKIYLIGYTPTPIDRFGREQAEIAKTSLGASRTVQWEHIANEKTGELIESLKKENFQIAAVEQTEKSTPFSEFNPSTNICYILGNEIDGVGGEFLNKADQVVEIPMKGTKESLNVSVTAGIILFKNG